MAFSRLQLSLCPFGSWIGDCHQVIEIVATTGRAKICKRCSSPCLSQVSVSYAGETRYFCSPDCYIFDVGQLFKDIQKKVSGVDWLSKSKR